ncbi:hypothetical protein ACTOB_003728 [Actinoplanes oblitus]|uniref:Uncharacterized protein n=1 Tax=Actinoplanes oblitus TaxID=3040509 RepID=A0ABY8WVJ1_9ACTN|nr:hypothetical protein [Actinoplanes oblitus]WIN00051.1 hypothetical protein ACTOB_003728 [Actinoplanes oblitus]
MAGQPVCVAVSASTASSTAAGYGRKQLVELARLCSAPTARWATRPMLRLRREVAAPSWPYWPVAAAVAYSHNSRHDGDIYRFDGWTRMSVTAGTHGGGTWSRRRVAPDTARGTKTLWLSGASNTRPATPPIRWSRSRSSEGEAVADKTPTHRVVCAEDTFETFSLLQAQRHQAGVRRLDGCRLPHVIEVRVGEQWVALHLVRAGEILPAQPGTVLDGADGPLITHT